MKRAVKIMIEVCSILPGKESRLREQILEGSLDSGLGF